LGGVSELLKKYEDIVGNISTIEWHENVLIPAEIKAHEKKNETMEKKSLVISSRKKRSWSREWRCSNKESLNNVSQTK